MRLSEHFTLAEFCVSQEAARRGINNEPPQELYDTLRNTAAGLERVRDMLGHVNPIIISSGYRNATVNALVNGKPTSQHIAGEAADFTCPGFGTPIEIARALEPHITALSIDQLILEFGQWVHVSFTEHPRHMALTIDRAGTRPGIV
jgi:zinc D-Ala-D-Ala carboxypeptidase